MNTTHHDTQSTATHACQPGAPAKDPFDVLDGCHRHILATLDSLEGAANRLAAADAFTDEPLARLAEVFAMLDTAIPLHKADEEETLFPWLRSQPPFRGHPGTSPMDCMEKDHIVHQQALATLKRCVMQRDVTATVRSARGLIAEYRDHIGKEDEVLFPMAKSLLTEPALLAEMGAIMRERRRKAGLGGC